MARYVQPRAFTRNEVLEKDESLNRDQLRLNELYEERMRNCAGKGGVDPRRRREYADAGMVKEDPRAMANLPLEAIHREFPQDPFYKTGPFNPSISFYDYEV